MSLTLRPYQQEAKEVLEQCRQNGQSRALIHLATGLGKTALAAVDALDYQADHTGSKILFVSHMNDINHQAADTFKAVNPKVKTAMFRTGHMPSAPVVFATFQSLHRNLHSFDPAHFEYIIWDEAHHIEATTFKAVREWFQPEFELGLTATPIRADGLDIFEYFGQPVYTKGLAEGIAEGWLSAVDYHIVLDDGVKQAIKDGFDAKSLQEIRELFSIRVRNEVIATNVKERRHAIGLDLAKTIVFCQNRQAAEEMAHLLGGKTYHSGIYKETRDQVMADFRNGKLQVICTVDMFNEGVDIPDARLVVFLRSTSSTTIFEQQLGRGLRQAPGKEHVTVLDFVANVERIDFVRDLGHTVKQARGPEDRTGRTRIGASQFAATINQENYESSNFIFEDETIELLKRYKRLSGPAPEGHQSTADIAATLGLSQSLVRKTAAELKLTPEFFQVPYIRVPVPMYSPEQVEIITQILSPRLNRPTSLHKIARERLSGIKTIREFCKEAGIEFQQYTFGKRRSLGLQPKQIEQLDAYIATKKPANALNSTQAAKVLGITRSGVTRLAKSKGVEAIEFLGRLYYTPEQIKLLKSRQQAHIDHAKFMKIWHKYQNVKRVCEVMGIQNSTVYLHLRKEGIYLDKERQRDKYEPLPNGHVLLSDFAKQLGVKKNTLAAQIKRLGLSPQLYKTHLSSPAFALSPEQMSVIQRHRNARQVKEVV